MEILNRGSVICFLAESEISRLGSYLSRYDGWPDLGAEVFRKKLTLWLSILDKTREGDLKFSPDEISLIQNLWQYGN